MPKITRFDRDRISKLFGTKAKPIHKPSQNNAQPLTKPFPTPIKNQPMEKKTNVQKQKQPQTQVKQTCQLKGKSTFKSSNYIKMIKVHNLPNNPKQIQKLYFKCYQDNEIYGEDNMMSFLKQNYDNDHQTPEQQLKYDVNRGIRKLKQAIQSKKNGEISEHANSQRGINSIGGTPPRFKRIKNTK